MRAFNMTFMCFVIIVWNIIYLWLFVASGRPFKSVRFKECDINTLATGTGFGGYFNRHDRLVWKFKLFLFRGLEMMLVHKITVCVLGSWNKIDHLITKYSKESAFFNYLYYSKRDALSILRSMKWQGRYQYLIVQQQVGPVSCIDDSDNPPSKTH